MDQHPRTVERYYFWNWNRDSGWKQTGSQDGYKTIEDLKAALTSEFLFLSPGDCIVTKSKIYWSGLLDKKEDLK